MIYEADQDMIISGFFSDYLVSYEPCHWTYCTHKGQNYGILAFLSAVGLII